MRRPANKSVRVLPQRAQALAQARLRGPCVLHRRHESKHAASLLYSRLRHLARAG